MPYTYNLVEAKHKYQMIDANYYLSNTGILDTNCVKYHRLIFPKSGSDETQRIGNKINNVQLRVEYNFSPRDYRFYLLPSTLSTSADPNFYMKFRVMVIDIPDSGVMDAASSYGYFSSMYVYTNNDISAQSTHTKSLRVSGPNTGDFNILYDEFITIDPSHPYHHKVFNIKLKDVIKFETGANEYPENHNYFLWFIMPKYYHIDVSAAVKDQAKDTLYNLPIDFRANIKLTWYDM